MHGFLESAGTVKVAVVRIGVPNQTIVVHYETKDGTASAGEDYIAAVGDLTFAPGELVKDIAVTLVDDNQWEPDETFDIVLSFPEKQPDDCKGAQLGDPSVSTITIINDDDPARCASSKTTSSSTKRTVRSFALSSERTAATAR